MSKILRVAAATLCLSLAIAAPVAAAKPTQEFITINDIGLQDEFLTEACGFDVFFDGTGHVILRQFTDANGDLVAEVNNFGIHVRFYSEFGETSVVDVGLDHVVVQADGSQILSIIGNVQSLTVPGEGIVSADNGQIQFHITFDAEGNPTFEFIFGAGQHPESDPTALFCAAIGP